jgi:hypothetical protein
VERDTFGHIRRYEMDQRLTLKFVLIYAILVHILHLNMSKLELVTVVCADFCAIIHAPFVVTKHIDDLR